MAAVHDFFKRRIDMLVMSLEAAHTFVHTNKQGQHLFLHLLSFPRWLLNNGVQQV